MNGTVPRILMSALALAATVAAATEFHIAPDGDDAHPGTRDLPFATLERGRDAVRALKQAGPLTEPVQVWLRGGVYRLTRPVVFTPADSGTADAPVTYASAPGEHAILSGGVPLTGTWQPVPGKPFVQLEVPDVRDGHWVFNSLFVNGGSRTRARHPNFGNKELRAAGREPGGDPRQALQYMPGDFNPEWTHPEDMDVVLLCSWTPTIHRVKDVLPAQRVLRFFSAHNRAVDFWERNFRYYVSNVFEALDEPGEWYLDRHAGRLYYFPMPGEDPATAEIVAPAMKSRMFEFAGDPAAGAFVEHIRFRGLSFRHLDGDLDRYNGAYRQGHMYLDAAVSARGLRQASFEGCELAMLGEYAMELAEGCREVTVRQCHFHDLGAGALQLGVSDLARLKEGAGDIAAGEGAFAVRGLVVDNNCIHRLGTIWHGCYGIVNRFASQSQITHNEIFDTHWDAIGLDARWTWKGEKYAAGNVVAYNHLHHLGLRYHTDAAGIYQFGPLDTHIHHNLIHDTFAYPYICGFAGIYLDEQSRGAVVENNLVFNTDWYAYFQNKGTDNRVSNNIGAFARNGFIGRGGLDATWPSNHFAATRNVYIAGDATGIGQGWEPGTKPPQVCSNMYWTLAKDGSLTFAGRSLADWQAMGRDAGSVVGDPGCRNPAAFDFSLPPDAPACRTIGFVPFDDEIRKAGLYGDAAWRELPAACARRAPSAVWSEDDLARFNSFDLDFNLMKDGAEPTVFRCTSTTNAGFAVSSEVAGTRGPKCLKCTDRKGLAKSFYPYIHFAPRALKQGTVTFSFAVRQPATNAARLNVSMRGAADEVGPEINIGRDGVVQAAGRKLGTLAIGEWTRIEATFALGPKSTRQWTLALRTPAGETTHTLPFARPTFDAVKWFGFTTPDDADGAIYLDEIKLHIAD